MDSMVEREGDGRVLSDPALVSDQAASRLAPPGFDPSRWLYRPDPYDDWGIVRAEADAEGRRPVICQARYPYRNEEELNEHRRNKTDPWEASARLIAAAPEMLVDLREAEKMFRWYGELHAAKPDPEKAARNYEMADRLAATIAKAAPAIAMETRQGGDSEAAPSQGDDSAGPEGIAQPSFALTDDEGGS